MPISGMITFFGLFRAYWISDRWKEAWGLTIAIFLLTAFISKSMVWIAEASGSLMNSIVNVDLHSSEHPLVLIGINAGILVLLMLLKDVALVGSRHFLSVTLHRKWRKWLNDTFSAALLDANHTHFHLQQGDSKSLPDNIDQRLQESIKNMTGGAIGLTMGIVGVLLSAFFIGQKLIEMSTEVRGLEFLGTYATAAIAFLTIVIYVPIGTMIAVFMGRRLERLNNGMQRAEGSYRGEWATLLRQSFQISASEGEQVQVRVNKRLYDDVDQTWHRLNRVDAAYLAFSQAYGFLSNRIVAYLPGLTTYVGGSVSFRNFITGAELVAAMINDCSWFIQVMPAIANLRANAVRVIDLAKAIENVREPSHYYARTGTSRFAFRQQHPQFGLSIRKVTLLVQPKDTTPLLRTGIMDLRAGDWAYMRGASGTGKTSLLKALNGLWPYGSGEIIYPHQARRLYVPQEARFPSVSLKQLVCLPEDADNHQDVTIAAILHEAGLGELIEHIHDLGPSHLPWDMALSGGQKQKLMLARLLLHKPDIIFLDEATSALDPQAKMQFHAALKSRCPDAIVISIMHEHRIPTLAKGEGIYTHVINIRHGFASLQPINSDMHDPFTDDKVTLVAAE